MSQETLEKLLSGKIRKMRQIENLKEEERKADEKEYRERANKPFQSSSKYKILYRAEFDERINDFINVVETIFIK